MCGPAAGAARELARSFGRELAVYRGSVAAGDLIIAAAYGSIDVRESGPSRPTPIKRQVQAAGRFGPV